jgi:ABC-type Fe3+/spermidine/putrescine transport system ATPase subunit
MHEVLLSIQGMSKTFDSGSTSYTAVKDVDLSVARGEVMSIIGHPGCGKSTLLGMISGLVSPTAGTLTLNGQPIKAGGGSWRGFSAPRFVALAVRLRQRLCGSGRRL